MTAANFDLCLKHLLAHEGGYTNHPSDPGGPTNFGITIADYRRYAKPNATADDVRAMRLDEAKAIYKSKYWTAQSCDALPPGLDYTMFDYGVNSGIGRSGKVLRRILGLPSNTAAISDDVLRAVAKRDPRTLIAAVNDERLVFLKSLKTWPVFGTGWVRRVAEVRAAALRMADAAPKGKAPNSSAARTTAGTIAVAGAAAAQQAHSIGAEPAVIATIVVVTVMLALGGWFAWRWHQRQRLQNG
jgi:lysozyme family protein